MKLNRLSSLALTVAGSTLWLFSSVSAVRASALIGIDFDVPGGTSPLNWNLMTPSQSEVNNLVDQTGAVTSARFTRITSFPTPDAVAGAIPANQLPSYSTSLAGLDGFFESSDPNDYWFLGLVPGALYRVWVFSFNTLDFKNLIAIETQNPPSFMVGSEGNQLFVNSELGDSSRSLSSYALVVPSWTSGPNTGGIGIEVRPGTLDGFWGLAGVAIERVPVPEPSVVLGLGLFAGVMSITRKRRR